MRERNNVNKLLTCVLAAMMFAAAPAAAHVVIKSSNIEQGGIYDAKSGNPIPKNLEIAFNADVGLAALRLETAAGDEIELDYVKPKDFQAAFVIPLPFLAIGDYVIHWRALAKDGHAMSGEINFSVK